MEVENLKKILSSQNSYSGTKKYIEAIQQGNMNTIKLCCEVAKNIFSDQQGPHQSKFWCLKFVNELLQVQEYEWIEATQKNILPLLEQFAQFQKEYQDDNRGKNLFIINLSTRKKYEQIKELEQIGDSFFRYTLESIWIWSKWFPLDTVAGKLSLFKIAQEKLSLMKVKFPTISYFDKNEVINHISIQRPPIELIQECRLKLQEHIKDNSMIELNLFQSLLEKSYFSEKKNNLNDTKTYISFWKYAVQQMADGKLGLEIQTKIRSAKMSQMQKKFLQFSVNNKKSRVALQQQVFSFTTVLNEKEKLLTDINNHILEKEQLNQQIITKEKIIQDLQMQNESLKQQVIQLKTDSNNKPDQNQQNDGNNQFQQLLSTKDLERLLFKKEIENKRQQDQIQHYQNVIQLLNSNFDEIQKIKMELENDCFKKGQELIQYKLQIEEQSNNIALLKQQNKRQIDLIESLRKQCNEEYQNHLQTQKDQIDKMNKLEQDNQEYSNQIIELQDKNLKLEIELKKYQEENNQFQEGSKTTNAFKQKQRDDYNQQLSISQNVTLSQLKQQQQQLLKNESKNSTQGFQQKKRDH